MELGTIFGLPAHPLLVHVAVVLAPTVALAAILICAIPRLRRPLGPFVALGAWAALGAVLVTAEAGEALAESRPRTDILDQHMDFGDAARIPVAALAVAVTLYVLYERSLGNAAKGAAQPQSRRVLTWLLWGATVVSASLTLVWVIQAGHTGAESVWGNVKVG
jgi:hypothetical protein